MKHGTIGAPVACAIRNGVRRNHACAIEHRHRHAVAAVVAIDEHRDDVVVGEPAADLQRRVERLADLDRVGAEHRRESRDGCG